VDLLPVFLEVTNLCKLVAANMALKWTHTGVLAEVVFDVA